MTFWPVPSHLLMVTETSKYEWEKYYFSHRGKTIHIPACDYLKNQLKYFIDEVECADELLVDQNLDVLMNMDAEITTQLKQLGIDEKVMMPEDGYLVVRSENGGELTKFSLYPLFELAEALTSNKQLSLNPVMPKSYYFACFGVRCLDFYDDIGAIEFLHEAYRASGYATQAYMSEITEEQRAEDKEKRISYVRQQAAHAKKEQTHDSWKPYLKEIIQNTDWSIALERDGKGKRSEYLVIELQKIINAKGLYKGVRGEGPTLKWVDDFRKAYEKENQI